MESILEPAINHYPKLALFIICLSDSATFPLTLAFTILVTLYTSFILSEESFYSLFTDFYMGSLFSKFASVFFTQLKSVQLLAIIKGYSMENVLKYHHCHPDLG